MDQPSAAGAQRAFLEAVLGGKALAGAPGSLRLPDLDLLMRGGPLVIADDNLAAELSLDALPVALQRVQPGDLARLEAGRGLLRFQQPASLVPGQTRLRFALEYGLTGSPGQPATWLGATAADLENVDGTWRAVGPAQRLAT